MIDAELRAHLVRLLGASVLSLIVAAVAARAAAWRPFALMTAAWGVIDLGIALAGLRSPSIGDPQAFRSFLAFNLGLNLAYLGVGTTMAVLAGERATVKGFGQAIVIQGALLLALDGWLWMRLVGT